MTNGTRRYSGSQDSGHVTSYGPANIGQRVQDVRARQDAQRRAARLAARSVKRWTNPADSDVVATILAMPLTD